MRRMICTLCTILLILCGTVFSSAQVGDIVSDVYSTDILTYIDGEPIQGYAINGKTVICVEDLTNYGFTVMYDDSIRTLFATQNKEKPDDPRPVISRGKVGEVTGHIYETDIRVILNGVYINAAALDGKMVIPVEEIGLYWPNENEGEPAEDYYWSWYQYDDSVRKLSLNTRVVTAETVNSSYYERQMRGNTVRWNDEYLLFTGWIPNVHAFGVQIIPTISYKYGKDKVGLWNILDRYRDKYGYESIDFMEPQEEKGKLIRPRLEPDPENSEWILWELANGDVYYLNAYSMIMLDEKPY